MPKPPIRLAAKFWGGMFDRFMAAWSGGRDGLLAFASELEDKAKVLREAATEMSEVKL